MCEFFGGLSLTGDGVLGPSKLWNGCGEITKRMSTTCEDRRIVTDIKDSAINPKDDTRGIELPS